MSRVVLSVFGADVPSGETNDLAASLEQAMAAMDVPENAQASLVLSTDEELRRLNRTYRDIDKPTDVLSFPFEDDLVPTEESETYLGDILISVPYASRSAAAAGRTLGSELRLLAVHGLLHLLGYEDETDEGAERMRQTEISLGVRTE